MINVTRQKDGLRVEVRGELEELMDELSHAAYAAACGALGAKDNRIDPEGAALFMLALLEGIDMVYKDMTGDKRGCLDRCEWLMMMRMGNPGRLQQEIDAIFGEKEVVQ